MHGWVADPDTARRPRLRERTDRAGERLVEWLREQQHAPAWVRIAVVGVITSSAGGVHSLSGAEAGAVLYVIAVSAAAWLLRGWTIAFVVVVSAVLSGVVRVAMPGSAPALPVVAANSVLRGCTLALVAVFVSALRRHIERADLALQVDALTGCESRRAILERLESEVRQARRRGTPLTVLYLDLDAFKSVNDAHGHAAGDEVLTRFADLVVAHVRERDVLGRVGGDEFLLVCPATPLREGAELAARLRGVPGLPPVSIGVASLADVGRSDDVHAADRAAASALLARADDAMYACKPR